MSRMLEIVRHYSRQIVNGRTMTSAFKHLVGELRELRTEIRNVNTGVDGIKGEVMDVVNCALDILFQAHPEITLDEIDALMEAKCRKWMLKYSDDGTDNTAAQAATDLVTAMNDNGADVTLLAKITRLDENSVRCVVKGSLMAKFTRDRLAAVYPVLDSAFSADCPHRFAPLNKFVEHIGPDMKTLGDILSADVVDIGEVKRYLARFEPALRRAAISERAKWRHEAAVAGFAASFHEMTPAELASWALANGWSARRYPRDLMSDDCDIWMWSREGQTETCIAESDLPMAENWVHTWIANTLTRMRLDRMPIFSPEGEPVAVRA